MNRNRKTITHSIRVSSILQVVVSTVVLAAAGLSYVYLKNQLLQYGDIQRQLERELTELRADNEVVRTQIASLSSRVVLEKRLAKDSLGLVPIGSDQIVRVNERHNTVGDAPKVVSSRGFN